jgi:hypothetical protein
MTDALLKSLDQLELPPVIVTALKKLKRRTVRGLVALRECDLLDALDDDKSVSTSAKEAAVRTTSSILNEMGLRLNPDGRFTSFAQLARCVLAAAKELGVPAREAPDHRNQPLITIEVPGGEVTVSEMVNWTSTDKFERIKPFREALGGSADDPAGMEKCYEAARKVLRRAQQLADAEPDDTDN